MVKKKKKWIGYKKSLEILHDRNVHCSEKEEVFWDLVPHAEEYIYELMKDFRDEKNRGIRVWLIDLIGYARSPDAFELLKEQLYHGDPLCFRLYAIDGLKKLDTKEARTVLWEYFQVLKEQLVYGDDPSLRIHAMQGLQWLDTREAYYALRSAKKLTFESDEETAKFQKHLSGILRVLANRRRSESRTSSTR